MEFHGESWKNQGLGLALSTRTYIQNVTPKLESLFGKEFNPIKTPMSGGYHPEIDNSPQCTVEDSSCGCTANLFISSKMAMNPAIYSARGVSVIKDALV